MANKLYIATLRRENDPMHVIMNPEDFAHLLDRPFWQSALSGTDPAYPLTYDGYHFRTISEALSYAEEPHLVWLEAARQHHYLADLLRLTAGAVLITKQNGAWRRDYALEAARNRMIN